MSNIIRLDNESLEEMLKQALKSVFMEAFGQNDIAKPDKYDHPKPSNDKNSDVEEKDKKYKTYLKIDEVVEITGLKQKTIREYCSRKLIPHIKLGGAVRFDQEDIEKWMQSKKVKVIREMK
jgi:excisionase family DNA binding protein